MRKHILLILILISVGWFKAQLTRTQNYVYNKTVVSKSSDSLQKDTLRTITYFDGLGRPKQNIAIHGAGSGKDLVTPIKYDGFGRQTFDILPVPVQTKNAGYHDAIIDETSANSYYPGGNAYSEKMLENSPLDRVLEQYGAGSDWRTHSKKTEFSYLANTEADGVRKFTASSIWEDEATKSTLGENWIYTNNQLYKNIVTDEDGNQTIEFKNGQGQTIMVRKVLNATEKADTYYVFNEYDQLAFVIPPLASIRGGIATDTAMQNELCYQYQYDGKGRQVRKKLPGKGWEHIVYNKKGQQILYQDENLRSTGELHNWLFTKYDQFGRVVYTGISRDGTSRQGIQNYVDNQSGNPENPTAYETRAGSAFNKSEQDIYYTNNSYPTVIDEVLSINYYDTYPPETPFPNDNKIFNQQILTDVYVNNRSVKSLPVASLVKNIGDDSWTNNYTFYDDKARAIGTHSQNHLGGSTVVHSRLDFTGLVTKTKTYHKRKSNNTALIIEENFEYDDQKRLTKHYHEVKGKTPKELLAENHYNDIGQLEWKKVGGLDNAELQKVDYRYNIRGWLTNINDLDSLNTNNHGDLFAYKIRYTEKAGLDYPNTDFPTYKVVPKYNGNIAEVDWIALNQAGQTAPSAANAERYGYVYDGLNRLKAGFYQNPSNRSFKDNHEIIEEYDLNGNIRKLKRTGIKIKNYPAVLIDDLHYTYNGNKVTNIDDVTGNMSGYEGGGGTIEYDNNLNGNGNMTAMPDKGISEITYNFLNLPTSITQNGNISEYLYRADGVKLKRTYTLNNDVGSTATTTEYLDGFHYTTVPEVMLLALQETDESTFAAKTAGEEEIYIDSSLDGGSIAPGNPNTANLAFFPTAEGFYDYQKNQYIYQYKDHLGNVRLSYSKNSEDDLEILDRNDYYPFGMNIYQNAEFSVVSSPLNYKYQSQELQETGFYSFKWRNYMPDVGRFFNIDPLAESFPYNSTYAFAENRVIDGRELEGLEWVSTKNDQGVTTSRQLTVSITNNSSKLNDKQFSKLVDSFKTNFSKTYGADGAKAELVISDKATIAVKLVDEKGTMVTDADGNEVGVAFKGGVTEVLGDSQKNGITVAASNDGEKRGTSDITRSFNHEAGHTAGLDHPWENRDKVSDINQNSKDVTPKTIKSNLLNSGANPNPDYKQSAGSSLTPGQLKKMDEVIQSQQPKN